MRSQPSVDGATLLPKQTKLLDTLKYAFRDAEQRKNYQFKEFIRRRSLEDIWTEPRLIQFMQCFRGSFLESDIETIRRNFLQTISILVVSDWDRDQWKNFRKIFLEIPDRTDQHIPNYNRTTLINPTFLGKDSVAREFLRNRYMFCPVDINQGMNHKWEEGWRLPFLDWPSGSGESAVIGEGGSGRVTKELVAPEHLHLKSGEPSEGKNVLACKQFVSRGDFAKEKRNLEALQAGLQHERIMPFFATIIIGKDFYLLFEHADTDLQKFLAKPPVNVSLLDLVAESRSLAGALAFLHEGMNPPQFICHMDLKPANILVFERQGESGVGIWKISDFGISITATPETRSRQPDQTFCILEPFKISGTYQSPEAASGTNIGRKTDVWSLGCILVRLVAYGLGGTELQELDTRRALKDDESGEYEHDYFYRDNPSRRNPHIEAWLERLEGKANDQLPLAACTRFRELLLQMLQVKPDDRLSAKEVETRLSDIIDILSASMSLNPPYTGQAIAAQPNRSIDAIYPKPLQISPYLVTLIQEDKLDRFRNLLMYPIDVEEVFERSFDGKSRTDRLLIHAILAGSYEAVETLLRLQPTLDKEGHDSEKNTPLYCAITRKHQKIVDLLLKEGVDVNARSSGGRTPLMQAACRGELDIVRSLLRKDADCSAHCENGFTCLHYATWAPTNGAALIQEFRGRMDLNILTSTTGETPLNLLLKNYNSRNEWQKKFEALRNAVEVDVNREDRNGMTPLYHAASKHRYTVMEDLCIKGARFGSKKPFDDHARSPTAEILRLATRYPESISLPPRSRWLFNYRGNRQNTQAG
ncbi:kinase-like domain-containing protein [Aspergillus egyptiacus]|nr:kinase-like domain-containing protein [Aspergillus egyptiacus]